MSEQCGIGRHHACSAAACRCTCHHKCANCYVAQYGMKSDLPCKNEWWALWDFLYGPSPELLNKGTE